MSIQLGRYNPHNLSVVDRDATHVCCMPVQVKGEDIKPGDKVEFILPLILNALPEVKKATSSSGYDGIADPFLTTLHNDPIPDRAYIWILMNPERVTAPKHAWTYKNQPITPQNIPLYNDAPDEGEYHYYEDQGRYDNAPTVEDDDVCQGCYE